MTKRIRGFEGDRGATARDSHDRLGDALVAKTGSLMKSTGVTGRLADCLLKSKTEREVRLQVTQSLGEQAAKIQAIRLEKEAEQAKLAIDVRYQIEKDAMVIEHRRAMETIGLSAEDQFTEAVNGLFSDKKRQLEQLDSIEGDPDLKATAMRYMDDLTIQGTNELSQRNSKPR